MSPKIRQQIEVPIVYQCDDENMFEKQNNTPAFQGESNTACCCACVCTDSSQTTIPNNTETTLPFSSVAITVQTTDRSAFYNNINCPECASLQVFGYGSLVWLPKFAYTRREIGSVKGFVRRFWQGNTTHRGTPDSPGRVVTLVEENKGETWGVAFHLKGRQQIEQALRHLVTREMVKGGYEAKAVTFNDRDGKPINVVTFIATPQSDQFLGPAPADKLAKTIVNSRGKSGHNLEYVFNLVDAFRKEAPQGIDHHLLSIETECHRHLSTLLVWRHQLFCGMTSVTTNCDCLKSNHGNDDHYVLHCLASRIQHIVKYAQI